MCLRYVVAQLHFFVHYVYPVRICAAGLCVWSRRFVYVRKYVSLVPRLYSTIYSVAWYRLHAHARNEASQVRKVRNDLSARYFRRQISGRAGIKSSSVILVYGVTIRWLHFAHAQSICTRPLDQKGVAWGQSY